MPPREPLLWARSGTTSFSETQGGKPPPELRLHGRDPLPAFAAVGAARKELRNERTAAVGAGDRQRVWVGLSRPGQAGGHSARLRPGRAQPERDGLPPERGPGQGDTDGGSRLSCSGSDRAVGVTHWTRSGCSRSLGASDRTGCRRLCRQSAADALSATTPLLLGSGQLALRVGVGLLSGRRTG